MPSKFGVVPPEVPRISSLDGLAPPFRWAVEAILADMAAEGFHVKVFETLRTDARQAYLYGFGRDYDDGRGPVTKARTAASSWHRYGLAADLVEDDKTPWEAPQAFWQALGRIAEKHGCDWGGRWRTVDLPHVQHGECYLSPRDEEARIFADGGINAVWRAIGVAA